MEPPKIKFKELKRTNLAFPSTWETKSEDGSNIKLHYRHGRLTLLINEKRILETSKDEFDIGGYLSDEDLFELLAKNDLIEK